MKLHRCRAVFAHGCTASVGYILHIEKRGVSQPFFLLFVKASQHDYLRVVIYGRDCWFNWQCDVLICTVVRPFLAAEEDEPLCAPFVSFSL